jgi:hypothetical protein
LSWWRRRRKTVELAALEAAQDDAHFEIETLEHDVTQLFRNLLVAIAAGDDDRLSRLVVPGHLAQVRSDRTYKLPDYRLHVRAQPPRLWLQLRLHGQRHWIPLHRSESGRESGRPFELYWQLALGGPARAPSRLISTSRRAPRRRR